MYQKPFGHWIGKLLFLCFTTALALGLAPESGPGAAAQTTSFTVNSTTDATDANPGDGVCETAAGNGVCTLRAAIQETNALAGADTITLPNGVYTLTIAGVLEDLAAFGDLDITDDLTITVAGPDITIIDGNRLDRVFHIVDSSTIVEMVGVTIQNGNVLLASEDGGGIYNQGTLTLRDSTLRENRAGNNGGGIHNSGTLMLDNSTIDSNTATLWGKGGGISNSGTLTLNNSTVSSNDARGSGGGGIYNQGTLMLYNSVISNNTVSGGGFQSNGGGCGIFNHGILTLTGSAVSNNVSNVGDGLGGGINNGEGILTLNNSTVSNNTAQADGGIFNWLGTLTLTNSTVSSNNSVGGGGGILNAGRLTLTNSVVNSNTVNDGCGGIFNGGFYASLTNSTISSNTAGGDCGGIGNFGVTLTLNNSTVSNNIVNENGGGIINKEGGTLTLNNSTISDNTANTNGGGIYQGPDSSNTLNLSNVTITNNTADNDSDESGDGGGVFNQIGLVNIRNSIIAGNHDNSPTTQHRDCSTARPLDSYGHNLIEDTTGCPIGRETASNLTGVSPGLGPLQDNGGVTFTHALLPGSPAIDAGNPVGCADHEGITLLTDQRGFLRIQDGDGDNSKVCDIGAYELGSSLPTFFYLPLVVTTQASCPMELGPQTVTRI